MRNMNQGEFYIYSPGGDIAGVDTIKVQSGRFAYETDCERPEVLMLVFPNFSEQPIFAEPGEEVTIKANASHLKAMTVKGTKANEQMNSFREQIAQASPPDAKRYAEQFIRKQPESIVCDYLLRRYFITSPQPDYKKAAQLLPLVIKARPKDGQLKRLKRQVDQMAKVTVGDRLPRFSVRDIRGRQITEGAVSGQLAVIFAWASWNYESTNMLHQLRALQRESPSGIQVIAISADPSVQVCRTTLKNDSVNWPVICDGRMLESPLMRKLNLSTLPDNIVLQHGKIVARDLSVADLSRKLRSLF